MRKAKQDLKRILEISPLIVENYDELLDSMNHKLRKMKNVEEQIIHNNQ